MHFLERAPEDENFWSCISKRLMHFYEEFLFHIRTTRTLGPLDIPRRETATASLNYSNTYFTLKK